MVDNLIDIFFDGYWVDEDKDYIPQKPGIYCVYTCTHHEAIKKIDIRKLVYIGEADNVRKQIFIHEKRSRWMEHVEDGEVLCFSFGKIAYSDRKDRKRAEAAMIFKYKPPCNDEYKDSFPYDETTLSLTGKLALLCKFTLNKT
jgi:hypothetical protein